MHDDLERAEGGLRCVDEPGESHATCDTKRTGELAELIERVLAAFCLIHGIAHDVGADRQMRRKPGDGFEEGRWPFHRASVATNPTRTVFGGAWGSPAIASRFARTPPIEKRSRSTPLRIVTTRVRLASARAASAATLAELVTTAAGCPWCHRSSVVVIGRPLR